MWRIPQSTSAVTRYIKICVSCLFVTALASALAAGTASAASTGAWSWGAGTKDELGIGVKNGSADVPTTVSDLSGVTAVAAGEHFGLALLGTGEVMAWGDDEYGALGDDCSVVDTDVPVHVSGLTDAIAISAGQDYGLALLADGHVMAWGGPAAELGDGSTESACTPVEVEGLTEVVAISAGLHHALALLKDGHVVAWGGNGSGQLGDGTQTSSDTPVEVTGLSDVTAVSAGGELSLALLANGTVYAWGDSEFGKLGQGSSVGPETCSGYEEIEIAEEVFEEVFEEWSCAKTPIPVKELSEVKSISAGRNFSVAVLESGKVVGWGSGYGALPVPVKGLSEVASVSAGYNHWLALLNDGKATESGEGEPVDSREVAGVAAGDEFSLAYGPSGPSVESVSKVSFRGGTVTITGTALTGATAVHLGSASATFKVESPTEIVASAPARRGSVEVTVTTPYATSAGSTDTMKYFVPFPEYGRCDGVAGTGEYKTASCESLKTKGDDEWFAGIVKDGFTTSGATATVETVGKAKVVCTAESGTGEYAGAKEAANVVIKLTGCESGGSKCASAGAKEGEIVTSALKGELGFTNEEKGDVAFKLSPASPEAMFAEFDCATTATKWRGAVLVPVTSGAMQLSTALKYSATKGKQKVEAFEEGPIEVLESSIGGKAFEHAGLTTTLTQANEEELEVNAFL